MAEVPAYMTNMLNQFGLGDLAPWLLQRYTDGATDAQIQAELYDQPLYQQRFPAMAALRARGEVVSEGEYVKIEQSYRQALEAYGLRGSVYDNRDTYTRLIESGVDTQELEERLQDAKMVADSTDPNVKRALSDMYGISSNDLMVYALDPKGQGKDHVDRLARSATLQGIAQSTRLQLSNQYAEQLATDSVFDNATEATYREALSKTSLFSEAQKRLAGIEGDAFTDQDAADVVIKADAQKTLASKQRAERESARFGRSQGLTASSMRGGSL